MTHLIIPIVGVSAITFWLDISHRVTLKGYSFKDSKRTSLPDDFNIRTDNKITGLIAEQLGLALPINLMKSHELSRHKSFGCKFNSIPKNIPANSFVRLDEVLLTEDILRTGLEIYVASPEYCFLSSAHQLNLQRLVELGINLCGNYALDSKSKTKQSFRNPITDANMIKNFLENARGNRGFYNALTGLKYICDGSNSPIESKLATTGLIHIGRGGFNLGRSKIELNPDITLSKEGEAVWGRKTCSCDIACRDCRLAVEYDSNETHLSANQHVYDKKKATALALSGYKLINLTYDDLKSPTSIENVFMTIRKEMGLRSNKELFLKYQDIRREVLLDLFFSTYSPSNPFL